MKNILFILFFIFLLVGVSNVLTENELIKRGLNPQYYEIVRDYVSEMEYEQWTQ